MGEYSLPILSLTSLPPSSRYYGKPSKDTKPSKEKSITIHDETFIKVTIPLEDEEEERVVLAWLYKGENQDKEVKHYDIPSHKHGRGYKTVKRHRGEGPIGRYKKGLIDPIEVHFKWLDDTTSLGFKKKPFHLGKKKFIDVPKIMMENSLDEDTFPYFIPPKIFNMLHDHVE